MGAAITRRECRGSADLERMIALARAFPDRHRHVIDLPYALCSPALETAANASLWEDDTGRLLGWAVWQPPFITLDHAVHPEARERGLEEEIVRWGIKRFQELGRENGKKLHYFIDAREDDPHGRALLERHGFVPTTRWQSHHLRRPLADPIPPAPPPDGFSLRAMAGIEEAAAAAALHRAAFGTNNMTDAWRGRIVQSPHYLPDLDVVAVAPDGRLAAYCLCWLDRTNPARISAQIEPLGVHPHFRRLGLGRAVLLEGLRRMQAHGASVAHVEVDSVNDAAGRLYLGYGGFALEYRALKYYREF